MDEASDSPHIDCLWINIYVSGGIVDSGTKAGEIRECDFEDEVGISRVTQAHRHR
jgi:hypothetical protein